MFTLDWLSYLLPQTSIVDSLAVWKQTDALSSLIGQVLARYCALIGSWSERMYKRHAIKSEQANWHYVNLYVNYMVESFTSSKLISVDTLLLSQDCAQDDGS